MSKQKLKESTISLDLSGFESEDLELVARMLQLAGQAEVKIDNQISLAEPMATLPTPELEPAPIAVEPEPMPINEPMDMDSYDGFDSEMDLISRYSGLGESTITNKDELDSVLDTDLKEEQILPDLSLNNEELEESSENEEMHGPFHFERDAVANAVEVTNGEEGNHFIVVPQGNQFFWKRTIQESAPQLVNTDGIENSRHEMTKEFDNNGDNNLRENEDDLDESAEDIFESLSTQYKTYLEGK